MSREIENIRSLMENKAAEFRDFKLTKIETRQSEDGQETLVVEGVPCVFDTETVLYKGNSWEFREKIARTAFDEADMQDVIFNYNHGGRVFARTRNSSLVVEVKSDGLHMRAELKGTDEGHKQLYSDIQDGLIDKMSFAFSVTESRYTDIETDEGPNVEIREITKIGKLYDVSAVDIPAYDTTEISARRTFEMEIEKRESERAEAVSLARAKYEYMRKRQSKGN